MFAVGNAQRIGNGCQRGLEPAKRAPEILDQGRGWGTRFGAEGRHIARETITQAAQEA